mmetsp:Transcript_14962/g.28956  ORF Transcript_14962/g.28956 Transcript_14962/m.28956 type:complete len:266 (-) Transcript_14962:900-1697(-)
MTTEPLVPAFSAINFNGYPKARCTMSAPIFCSSLSRVSLISGTFAASLRRVHPPPITIPSWTAAFVALRASSTLSFFSFNSVSVWAPTWTMATPPLRRAILSFSFSFSYSASAFSYKTLICLILSFTASSPEPSPTIVQCSFAKTILAAVPSTSAPHFESSKPSSSLTTVAPVKIPISSRYWLFLSPNPGAFMATTFRAPLILLTTRVARGSCSMSSAMIRTGYPPLMASSRMLTMSRAEVIFLSTRRRRQFSYSVTMRSVSVTK